MTANVYIDGFNLYYCGVKGTPYKWLNLQLLCNTLFPSVTISKIKYFSALVYPLPHDPGVQTRQLFYWRALETIPNLEIIKGNFVSWPKLLPQFPFAYVHGLTWPPQKVQVERAEEKGSDVNLAAYLVYDNCNRDADESIVISNDSDLVNAIALVTQELHRNVTIVNPNRTDRVHADPRHCGQQQELRNVSTHFIGSINPTAFAASQFLPNLTDARGSFHKPPTWQR
jgi:uncharacterized LabA/DUF88 family protein